MPDEINPLLFPLLPTPGFLPSELGDHDEIQMSVSRNTFRIGLLIPMCGSAGIWAPSCISSAQVAVAQLNDANGICGRQVELIMIDSAFEASTPVEEVIHSLIDLQAIDAIVGMHISTVRQNLSKIVKQRVPYIYTPLYEGGEKTRGIFAIGDTPEQQLGPALDYFRESRGIERWALIGNDYVWPRESNYYAKQKLKACSSTISFEQYLPFGLNDMSNVVQEIGQSGAQAVLISLVGQDAVTFNRAFGKVKMHEQMMRLSCAIEENGLLASGEENVQELYSVSSYFASLSTSANACFREKYHGIHGEFAPTLNALGQSTYEGVQFLAGLMQSHENDWKDQDSASLASIEYASVRCENLKKEPHENTPIYLAKADGVIFRIINKL